MREIEIKARLLDKQSVLDKLASINITLSKPIKQHDMVYSLPNAKDNALGANWLRIRIENDKKTLFTLKRSVVGHLDSIEHETEVADPSEMQNIITMLGYEPYSDLTKLRQKAKHKDLEICIDHIEGLGDFIEIEKMSEQDVNHEETEAILWKFMSSIGIDKKDEVLVGYDVMERQQRGDKL